MFKKYIIIILIIIVIFIILFSNVVYERKNNNLKENNSLNGKTIALIGDSLIAGYGNEEGGFKYYLEKYLPNTKIIDNSKSGSTITDNTGADNIIIMNQVKTLNENPDIIIFNGGINDIVGYGFGYLDDNLKKEIGSINQTENTVIGDLEKIIIELKNKFPKTELYYLQLFLMNDESIKIKAKSEESILDILDRREKFYSQIKPLCEKNKVKYIDVSNKFDEFDENYRQDDLIHLKKEAYEILTKIILEDIKNN